MCSRDLKSLAFGSGGEKIEGQFSGSSGKGSMLVSQSMILDGESGELVNGGERVGTERQGLEGKTVAALKSHSEAERRRRERINAHLATLRGLVPFNEKMDKATLLAEVIDQVKQLKKVATQVSNDLFIPMDSDEVKVEELGETADGNLSFRASLCCSYRPDLLSDLRQTIDALPVNLVKAEISTLGNRVKNVLFFTNKRNNYCSDPQEHLPSIILQALSSLQEKVSALSEEYSPRTVFPNKRQRSSYFYSSSSSS